MSEEVYGGRPARAVDRLWAEVQRLRACLAAMGIDPAAATPELCRAVCAQWQADWDGAARDGVLAERLAAENAALREQVAAILAEAAESALALAEARAEVAALRAEVVAAEREGG